MFSRRAGRPEATGGLTKTQQLRQAKTASRLKEFEQKEQSRLPEASKRRVKSRYEPKKLDFTKPSLTKAMMARVKHAEKIKEEYERKTVAPSRMPKRTAAPVAGDARLGREKSFRRHSIAPSTFRSRSPSPFRMRESSFVEKSSRSPDFHTSLSEKATELAKSMTADILESEPIGEGVIDSVVIPPGIVNEDRTTVITIPQPISAGAGSDYLNATTASQVANRSIQVISESLDEQDVAESVAVQQRLADLQQARRDFVIAVATVGGNSVNIPEAEPQRRLYRIPSLEDDMFRVEYGLDHPTVVAARQFAQKTKEGIKEREGLRRMEEEFERYARETVTDDLHMDIPFEEEFYQDPELSWEEDDSGQLFPRPSRVKAHVPQVPTRQETYRYDPFDAEDLEKFFDVQRYPPCQPSGPPPGREQLHPDLWELEDPWFRAPQEPDSPDLIHFSRED